MVTVNLRPSTLSSAGKIVTIRVSMRTVEHPRPEKWYDNRLEEVE